MSLRATFSHTFLNVGITRDLTADDSKSDDDDDDRPTLVREKTREYKINGSVLLPCSFDLYRTKERGMCSVTYSTRRFLTYVRTHLSLSLSLSLGTTTFPLLRSTKKDNNNNNNTFERKKERERENKIHHER